MLAQNDIKKTLGFSTIGQMGYMIMECGLGAFSLGVFHLIAHGLFKATVFLNCGNVIHKARQEPHSLMWTLRRKNRSFSRADLVHRIRDDPPDSPADPACHARSPAHSASRIAGDGHLSVLHLDYLVAGDPDTHAITRRRVLESLGRHADDPARSSCLSICSPSNRSPPSSTRIRDEVASYFQGGGSPGLALRPDRHHGTTLTIVVGWFYLYMPSPRADRRMPAVDGRICGSACTSCS